MVGINNITSISMDNLSYMGNSTSVPEIWLKINYIVYEGVYFYVMCLVLWWILYKIANEVDDQPLNNAMYSCATVSMIAFILRAVTMTMTDGKILSLLTDHQMWTFPIITSVLAAIVWATKD